MEKVYIVLEENYSMLASECGASRICGCYTDKAKAIERALIEIKKSINDYDFIIDEEKELHDENTIKAYLEKSHILLFYEYQENWDYYYEISVKELEVK